MSLYKEGKQKKIIKSTYYIQTRLVKRGENRKAYRVGAFYELLYYG